MREILFRGKRMSDCAKSARKWVDGNLEYNHVTEITFIRTPRNIYVSVEMVDPSTIGQYTGLTDKNGVKIFEGDILMHSHEDGHDFGIVRFGERSGLTIEAGFYVDWVGENASVYRKDLGYWARVADCEVHGNIHDNPELLEEEP